MDPSTSNGTAMEQHLIKQFLPSWDVLQMEEYNCSIVRPPGKEWTRAEGETQVLFGVWSFCFGIITELLYIPCVYALYRELKHTCYKIMFYLAIVDMIALFCNSCSFGVLLLIGAVYCSYPGYIWITGALGLGIWCAACIGCLLLVCNRLLELLGLTFITEVLFNSKHGAMFFDPFIGLADRVAYLSLPHTANNLVIVTASAALYLLLCIVVVLKRSPMSSEGRAKYNANKPIFVQASLICLFNVVTSLIYVYMNFWWAPSFLVQVGQICWQLSHGCPPFIYIWLNRTVRTHCRRFLIGDTRSQLVRSTTVSTSLSSRPQAF